MPYQHILVAVDLTEECDPVMHRAQKLAAASGSRLSVVHIVEPMAMAFGGDVPMDLSQLQQQQFDQAKERMDRLFNKYPDIQRGDSHLTYGQPRQEIHQLAKDQKCDLIVVGSHGRHGLALLLGMWISFYLDSVNYITALEEVDSALLADDLPPEAFLDNDFFEWLKDDTSAE